MTTPRLRRAAGMLVLAVAAPLLAACGGGGPRVVEIGMRYSRYTPAALTVRAGDTVRFVLRNDDPIAHEFVLGTAEEHALHEEAADESHDDTPGQASLEPGETDTVEYTFTKPGSILFACHRPGHFRYGMSGVVTVT